MTNAEKRLTPSQRLKTRLIAAAASPIISSLCRTITWKVEGLQHYDEATRSGRPPIMAFWHGRILPATWVFRNRGIVVIASANFDGQWMARIIERFGYGSVAGSTSRSGARALLELKREIERGHPVAFALDGPRGPARVAQPGAVWLAGATGSPILPFHAEATHSWTMRSWDRTQVPRPFGTVALAIDQPIFVGGTEQQYLEQGGVELAVALAKSERATLAWLKESKRA
jgi:lysophospholipid acyltransferase (LPLAT)-like uncharacterized protein